MANIQTGGGENILPFVEDAKSRLLKRDAITLSGTIAARGVPVGYGWDSAGQLFSRTDRRKNRTGLPCFTFSLHRGKCERDKSSL